jgi:protein gp37
VDLGGRLDGIHWVVVGGQSGHGFRPMDMAWARAIRDACVDAKVAFFFKQDAARMSGTRPWLVEADGRRWRWHQFPSQLTPLEALERPRRGVQTSDEHLPLRLEHR